MQFDKVQCVISVMQDGNPDLLSVVKAGPGAISASEIPVLRAKHEVPGGPCAVNRVIKVGSYESTAKQEVERLTRFYGKMVGNIYPGGRLLAKTIADCELPDEALAEKPKAETKD